MATEIEAAQADHELAGYDFGAISAGRTKWFLISDQAKNDQHTKASAKVVYAVVRNGSGVTIHVLGEGGNHILDAGEKKVVAFPTGATGIEVRNTHATTAVAAGEVTADIGISRCCH